MTRSSASRELGTDRARRARPARGALLLVLLLALPAASSGAQEWYEEPERDSGGVSVRGSVGFTADPETFLMGFSVPIAVGRHTLFSPLFQLGVDDDHTIVAPSAQLEYHIDFSGGEHSDFVRRIEPFLQIGGGFVFIHEERSGNDDDEVGLLLNSGLGIEFRVLEDLFLGSNLLFNVLPFEVSGEHFFLSWQFATMRIRF